MVIAAFLFFCSTGLFFGGALRRHPAIIALAGLISLALAILVYRQSSDAIGGAKDFLVPYLYFVSSAAMLGNRFWKRPRIFAAAGLIALAFAVLAYPQMYETIDWIHRKSTGAIYALTQMTFREAESGLKWVVTAGSSNAAKFVSKEAVLHSVVSTTMVLFFAASGLASRLFVLSKRRPPNLSAAA
jgi:ABC-type transport system involved in multi-copper enzyme maturation permease subunit